jgi:hypothetical protein
MRNEQMGPHQGPLLVRANDVCLSEEEKREEDHAKHTGLAPFSGNYTMNASTRIPMRITAGASRTTNCFACAAVSGSRFTPSSR